MVRRVLHFGGRDGTGEETSNFSAAEVNWPPLLLQGKTLQTIAFIGYLKVVLGVGGPHLVVCPLSVLHTWATEVSA
jgi:hypothetical protein